jgi:hypothetical protein
MKLSELIKTTEIAIPGMDLKIVLRDDISWYDYQRSLEIKDIEERGIFMVAKMIESWNLTGDDGKTVEITGEIIKKFPPEVANVLVPKINKIIEEKNEKKKISRKTRFSS